MKKLPKVTSTTEIVRNIAVLTKTSKDQMHIITKGKKEIGVYIPMDLYRELEDDFIEDAKALKKIDPRSLMREIKSSKNQVDKKIPDELKNKLKGINGVAFQRKIRSEY